MSNRLKTFFVIFIVMLPATVCAVSFGAAQNPIESCKISKANTSSVHLGLDRSALFMKSLGTIKILVAGIDFANARESSTPAEMVDPFQLAEVKNFYRLASYGKLNLEFTVADQVVNLPQTDTSQNDRAIARAAAENFPNKYNLSEFDGLILIAPKNSSYSASSAIVATTLVSKNGQISSSAVLAGVKPGEARWLSSPWRTLVHELGHMMGLMDLWNRQDSQAWEGRTSAPFGIMNTGAGWSYAADFFAWEKWVLGWIQPEQVWCQDLLENTSQIELTKPLENSGFKLIAIRVSQTEALIIEVREKGALDYGVTKPGLLVYRIDFTKNQFEVPITLVPSNEAMKLSLSEQTKDWFRFKSATLSAFETVDAGNWRIGSTSSSSYQVLLSRKPISEFNEEVVAMKAKEISEAQAKAQAEAQAEAQAKAQAEAQAKAQAEAQARARSAKIISIKCIKGKKIKVISGLKPKCPTGYSRK